MYFFRQGRIRLSAEEIIKIRRKFEKNEAVPKVFSIEPIASIKESKFGKGDLPVRYVPEKCS